MSDDSVNGRRHAPTGGAIDALRKDLDGVTSDLQRATRDLSRLPWPFDDIERQLAGVHNALVAARVRTELARDGSRPVGEDLQISTTSSTRGTRALARLLAQLRERPLRTSTHPVLSIVIPTFNNIECTLKCLVSISRFPPSVPYEVVVTDDCSTDAHYGLVACVPGVRLERRSENGGFIGASNHGAACARGTLVLFLNNDTEVTAAALDELVATLESGDDVGVVGAKLLWPDGTLQEAGGVLFSDGSAMTFGRGGRPDAAEVSFARDVDYVSGAALLIRRDTFDALGGFDPLYAPAYYEDADLCQAVRSRGLRVVYQPLAEVIHHEGLSYGTGQGDDKKRRQMERNRHTFVERWQDRLVHHGNSRDDIALLRDRLASRQVLVIRSGMVEADHDAHSFRMARILRDLKRFGSHVTFVALDQGSNVRHVRDLQRIGIEVATQPGSPTFAELLDERGERYDLVILSDLDVAATYLRVIRRRCPNAAVVFDAVELEFLRDERDARRHGATKHEIDLLARELVLEMMAGTDVTLVGTTSERDFLRLLRPQTPVEVSVESMLRALDS